MIRANIYSTHELNPNYKKAVLNGLELVGRNIGGIAVAKNHIVKLAKDFEGLSNPKRVGYNQMNRDVELHVFAAPFTYGGRKPAGAAFMHTGVSWINTRGGYTASEISSITAHETAHSLGYVLPSSSLRIKSDGMHCTCSGCIMQPTFTPMRVVKTIKNLTGADRTTLNAGLRLLGDPELAATGFCSPCVNDMRESADGQIAAIRLRRMLTGVIISDESLRTLALSEPKMPLEV